MLRHKDRFLSHPQIRNPKGLDSEAPKAFTFDQVYDWNSTQSEIFDITARTIVDAAMDGYNGKACSVLASTVLLQGEVSPCCLSACCCCCCSMRLEMSLQASYSQSPAPHPQPLIFQLPRSATLPLNVTTEREGAFGSIIKHPIYACCSQP